MNTENTKNAEPMKKSETMKNIEPMKKSETTKNLEPMKRPETQSVPLTDELLRQRLLKELERRDAQKNSFNEMLPFEYVNSSAADLSLEFRFTPQPWTLNLYGTVHGGITTSFPDIAMGILCRACTGDLYIPTVDLHMSFLKTFRAGEPITCKARILHLGRKLLTTRAELFAGDNVDPSALITATYARM